MITENLVLPPGRRSYGPEAEPDGASMASLVTMASAIEVLEYWSIGVLEKLWKPPPGVAKSLGPGFPTYPGYFTVDQ